MDPSTVGERSPARWLVGAAVGLLLASRAPWIFWARTTPVSDFAVYHELAARIASGSDLDPPLSSRLAGWGYPVALGALYRAFGAGLPVAWSFDLLLAAISLVLLVVLTARVAGRRAATFAAALFLVWPEQLVYSSVLASEHLALALTLLALILLVPGPRGATSGAAVRSAAAGVAAGLALSVRPALVSLAVAGTASLMPAMRSAASRTAVSAAFAIAVLATVWLWNGALYRALGTGPVGSGWYSLMVGANEATGGKWSKEDLAAFASRSADAPADGFARREALHRIETLGGRYVGLVLRKMGALWRDDGLALRWSTAGRGARGTPAALETAYRGASTIFHLALWVLALVGAAYAAFQTGARSEASARGALLLVLFVAAGTLLHGVLETQSRYHYVLEPALLVLAAVALDRLLPLRTRAATSGPIR
jgi:hypothetical protein